MPSQPTRISLPLNCGNSEENNYDLILMGRESIDYNGGKSTGW